MPELYRAVQSCNVQNARTNVICINVGLKRLMLNLHGNKFENENHTKEIPT